MGACVNGRRLEHSPGTTAFLEEDAQLRRQLAAMDQDADEELADAKLRRPCRKVLQSLREHRVGLVRFVDHPEIPMDNNASERAGRGPAVGRKNYYGSGALWSARLAATTFSIVATLKLWGLNPRVWMTWYFVSFRWACVKDFRRRGIVGCRHLNLWRTADGYQTGTRAALPAGGGAAAI